MTKQEAIDKLRKELPPGSTVHCVIRHVSQSGMTRWIDFYHLYNDPEYGVSKAWLSYWIAMALNGVTFDKRREAVKVGGCGMDMGFHVVNGLSYVLHGMDPTEDNPKPGYSLRHEWI